MKFAKRTSAGSTRWVPLKGGQSWDSGSPDMRLPSISLDIRPESSDCPYRVVGFFSYPTLSDAKAAVRRIAKELGVI